MQAARELPDWLETREPLQRDHVMRPQSWYITDLNSGEVLVKKLFLLGPETEALCEYLRGYGVGPLGWINRSERLPLDLTPAHPDMLAVPDPASVMR